jgi:hypothetical protein
MRVTLPYFQITDQFLAICVPMTPSVDSFYTWLLNGVLLEETDHLEIEFHYFQKLVGYSDATVRKALKALVALEVVKICEKLSPTCYRIIAYPAEDVYDFVDNTLVKKIKPNLERSETLP